MNVYEGMFLLNSVEARREWEGAMNHVQDILKKSGAEISTNYRWDERRLAYDIKGQKRGTYYLVYFKAEPDAIATIRRDCRLSELILRQLILRYTKEIPPAPSKTEERGTAGPAEAPAGRPDAAEEKPEAKPVDAVEEKPEAKPVDAVEEKPEPEAPDAVEEKPEPETPDAAAEPDKS